MWLSCDVGSVHSSHHQPMNCLSPTPTHLTILHCLHCFDAWQYCTFTWKIHRKDNTNNHRTCLTQGQWLHLFRSTALLPVILVPALFVLLLLLFGTCYFILSWLLLLSSFKHALKTYYFQSSFTHPSTRHLHPHLRLNWRVTNLH